MSRFSSIVLVTLNHALVRQVVSLPLSNVDAENIADFNKVLDNSQDEVLYGFIGEHDNFESEYSLQIIIDKINELPHTIGAYTDGWLCNNTHQLLPAYNPRLFLNAQSVKINTPIFCLKPKAARFNEALKVLYFDDFIKTLGKSGMLVHIAQNLTRSNLELHMNDIQHDLSILNANHPSQ